MFSVGAISKNEYFSMQRSNKIYGMVESLIIILLQTSCWVCQWSLNTTVSSEITAVPPYMLQDYTNCFQIRLILHKICPHLKYANIRQRYGCKYIGLVLLANNIQG